jgi:hypothetical protein
MPHRRRGHEVLLGFRALQQATPDASDGINGSAKFSSFSFQLACDVSNSGSFAHGRLHRTVQPDGAK